MVSTVKSFAQYFRSYPLRAILTLLTIAIGVGALTITLSLSFDVSGTLQASLSEDGKRIVIANAEIGDDGMIQQQFPPGFDTDIVPILHAEYENLRDIAIVGNGRWNRVSVGDTSYQIRSSSAVSPEYANLMDLEMVAGSFFTASDVDVRNLVVVLSASAARILFGSVEAAIGAEIEAAVPTVGAGGGAGAAGTRFRISQQPYSVVGVFEDVSELERDAFGVSDFLIPVGTNLPAGLQIAFDPSSVLMARLVDDSVATASSRIGVILELEYGDDTAVSVWEGSPSGPKPLIEQSRRSVRSFALVINVLGAIILIASSIGIFSIMLVEVLNRMREIGLRRAIGATRSSIRRFFMMQALYFSLAGSAVGTGLAFVFYRMVGISLLPFFETAGFSASDLDLSTPGVLPVVFAATAAVVVGAVFGFFPAVSASRSPIVECIRDDAA